MKRNEAIKLLNLQNKKLTIENINKHYKLQALKFHPDKRINKSIEEFCKVKDAHEFLLNDINNNQFKNMIFCTFDKINIKDDYIKNNIYDFISSKISNLYDSNMKSIIKKFDHENLIKLCNFLEKNNDVLHIPEELLNPLFEVIKNKNMSYKTICLKPNIDDIFENNVYKLVYENNTYIIPLWHHELYYDTFCVKIIPELPENIEIDENNNILINISMDIRELLNKEYIYIKIGNKNIKVNKNKIKIKNTQSIILYKQGISKIDNVNIYNISNISNIIIKLNLM